MAENDWEIENRRGCRDIVNINRIKPYVGHDNLDTALDHNREGCTDNGTAGQLQESTAEHEPPLDSGDNEFFDALHTAPSDHLSTIGRDRRRIYPRDGATSCTISAVGVGLRYRQYVWVQVHARNRHCKTRTAHHNHQELL